VNRLIAVLFLGVVTATGCGDNGPPMGTVAGKVTIAGAQPKEAVRISFVNNSIGQGAGASLKPDGSYSLDLPLPLAEYTVFLTKVPEATDGPATTASEVLTSVAREYRTEEKSPLKFEVKQGANQFDIDVPGPAAAAAKK
jgi:hypothetical protein